MGVYMEVLTHNPSLVAFHSVIRSRGSESLDDIHEKFFFEVFSKFVEVGKLQIPSTGLSHEATKWTVISCASVDFRAQGSQ